LDLSPNKPVAQWHNFNLCLFLIALCWESQSKEIVIGGRFCDRENCENINVQPVLKVGFG